MRNELQDPWKKAATQAGIRPSFRGIAERANVGLPTVVRLITEGRTKGDTVEAVAQALRVDPALVRQWANISTSELGPWTPPEAAHKLGPRARAALTELILAITQEDEREAHGVQPRKKSDDDGEVIELRPNYEGMAADDSPREDDLDQDDLGEDDLDED